MSYTDQAVSAMARAVDTEHDFAGWLRKCLARVAAHQGQRRRADGGPPRLVGSRPGRTARQGHGRLRRR